MSPAVTGVGIFMHACMHEALSTVVVQGIVIEQQQQQQQSPKSVLPSCYDGFPSQCHRYGVRLDLGCPRNPIVLVGTFLPSSHSGHVEKIYDKAAEPPSWRCLASPRRPRGVKAAGGPRPSSSGPEARAHTQQVPAAWSPLHPCSSKAAEPSARSTAAASFSQWTSASSASPS